MATTVAMAAIRLLAAARAPNVHKHLHHSQVRFIDKDRKRYRLGRATHLKLRFSEEEQRIDKCAGTTRGCNPAMPDIMGGRPLCKSGEYGVTILLPTPFCFARSAWIQCKAIFIRSSRMQFRGAFVFGRRALQSRRVRRERPDCLQSNMPPHAYFLGVEFLRVF